MRNAGIMYPQDGIPLPPDTVATLLIAGSSGQAWDWGASGSSGLSASCNMVRITAQSTAGAPMLAQVNLSSTKAAAPSSGTSTEGTTGHAVTVFGQGTFSVPGGSTGFSVASLTSGYVTLEQWKRGG